jgi:prepilin-type N-terminal cleavage/methylation domain-containing protein
MFMRKTYDQLQAQNANKSKGFTLIEVMIVIVIIGILAALAIVVFKSQQISAFNTAALSALSNIAKHEESLFFEASEYGTTNTDSTAGAQGKGSLITGGSAAGYLVSRQNSSSNPQFREFRAGEGVSVVIAADSTYQSFVITAKHVTGDRRYCFDSENGRMYYDNKYASGEALTRGRALSAGLNTDDCAVANMTEL